MNTIEFINKLKINNNQFISNNILFFLGNLNKFNIKKIIEKPLNKILKGCCGGGGGGSGDGGGGDGGDGGDGCGNSKANRKINNLEEFIFSDTKFIARIIHGYSTDTKGKTHTIKFVSLDDLHENSIGCATLNFDYDMKTTYVQNIGDYGNCVFCLSERQKINKVYFLGCPSSNVNFRVGQILILMIISLCMEKKNINKIELTDISKFNYMNTYNKNNHEYTINPKLKLHDNFDLMIISTLMKGKPYYSKYGFEPKYKEDKEILNHNMLIFNKKIKLANINLINFILDNKNNLVDKNIKIEQYEDIINNIIIPEIKKFENNSIDKFIYSILNINPKKIDDKIMLCNIILSFYKYIFNKMNYHEFKKKIFVKNFYKF